MKNRALNLPNPDLIASQHSDRLNAYITAEIERCGPISFARYMQLALYAPGLGYYSAGAHKLGEAGDFITAPELSPLFSHCVARQCEQVLRDIANSAILELGAGSGVMALEILRELYQRDCLPTRYFILEISADLRERQQQLFHNAAPELLLHVEWLDELPSSFNGIVLANEVIDAMPVHKVKKTARGWQEFYVTAHNNQFAWQLGELSDKNLIAALPDVAENYETEINLLVTPWIASLAAMLQQGVILLVDYGFPQHEYFHHDRTMGTLMCHYRHLVHADPLCLVGLQDITAHVDFSAVAQAAAENNLEVVGFTHQAAFLINCGLTQMLQQDIDGIQRMHLHNQVKQLTLPSEMGELFKAMALTKNYDELLLGFSMMNQVERL